MGPKTRIVTGLFVCIAASVAIVLGVAQLAPRAGWTMPSGQRSGGEWFPVFILVVLVALFLGGAILLRQQFQAAAKTNGAAFISGFAFATFPFWFVPLTLPLIIVIVDKCG